MSYSTSVRQKSGIQLARTWKVGSYLDQLILHIVAEARVLVAVPEVLCIVLSGCARGGMVTVTTVLRGSVRHWCHLVEIWKERFVVQAKGSNLAERDGRARGKGAMLIES